MLAVFLFTLSVLAAGEACNDVEDPIKNDEGTGPWNVSRVERLNSGRSGKLVAVDLSSHPFPNTFYEGDSYVVQYSVREGRKADVLYYWQGNGASVWEQGAAAILTVQLDNEVGGVAKQARVEMGSEPAHFIKMFKGAFVTLLGGKVRETVEQDKDGVMLFKVKSECNEVGDEQPITRTQQVQETSDNLNNDDAFVLKTPSKVFVYEGENASAEEKNTALKVAASMFPADVPEVVSGPTQPQEFLAALA